MPKWVDDSNGSIVRNMMGVATVIDLKYFVFNQKHLRFVVDFLDQAANC